MWIKWEDLEIFFDLVGVWGICFNGLFYVKWSLMEGFVVFVIFMGMKLRGKICYYDFEEEEMKMIMVLVYNFLNGCFFCMG